MRLDILPYDDIHFVDVLNALWQAGFIKKYSWQNKYYGCIPSWHQHQSINKHEPASKSPNPEKCVYETCTTEMGITSHVQNSAMQIDLSESHMHARACQRAVSTSQNLEKSTGESSINEQSPSLHMQAYAKQVSASAMHEPVSTGSTLTLKPTIKNKEQVDVVHANNLLEPIPEPVQDVCTLAPMTENPILCTPISDVHMHARALHEDISAKHNAASTAHVPASLEVEVEMEVEEEVEREVEEEVEQGLGSNRHIVAPARRRLVKTAEISKIFNHWKTTLQHPQAVLDKKRHRLIEQALQQGYTVTQLCDAISGCAQTPHNPRRKRSRSALRRVAYHPARRRSDRALHPQLPQSATPTQSC